MFNAVQKPYFLMFANLQSNKREKKETLRFSLQFFAYMHLSKSGIFYSYRKSWGTQIKLETIHQINLISFQKSTLVVFLREILNIKSVFFFSSGER